MHFVAFLLALIFSFLSVLKVNHSNDNTSENIQGQYRAATIIM